MKSMNSVVGGDRISKIVSAVNTILISDDISIRFIFKRCPKYRLKSRIVLSNHTPTTDYMSILPTVFTLKFLICCLPILSIILIILYTLRHDNTAL